MTCLQSANESSHQDLIQRDSALCWSHNGQVVQFKSFCINSNTYYSSWSIRCIVMWIFFKCLIPGWVDQWSYDKTTWRNCLWESCSFSCFVALSLSEVPGCCLVLADIGTGIRLVGGATLTFCKWDSNQTGEKKGIKIKELKMWCIGGFLKKEIMISAQNLCGIP